jgi:hypothetical protein
MASNQDKLEGRESEIQSPGESADSMRSADEIRGKIGAFLPNSEFRKTLDRESLANYEKLVAKNGDVENDDVKSLTNIHKFMKGEFEKIQTVKKRMAGLITQAIADNVITEEDKLFYQQKIHANVFTGDQIVTKEMMERTENELSESIGKRQAERGEYDSIAKNPMIKNGELAVSDKEKIKIPDEKGYLKMSVPERRKFLKEVKDAMPKAKEFAEKNDEIESKKAEQDYSSLLEKAQKERVVGKKTAERSMENFKKLSLSEKKTWVKELANGNQLKRYRDLWSNIRKTLKGETLKRMEGLRDSKGYTELFAEFGKLKEQESLKLTTEYGQKLEQAYKGKVISKHTKSAFLKDMQGQTLEQKRFYMESFDMQMARYKTLRGQIDQMKDKGARRTLDDMYESENNGYSEIQARYTQLISGHTDQKEDKKNPMAEVADISVRKGIMKANELLKEQGREKRKTFLSRIRRMVAGEQNSRFNASGFQANLRQIKKDEVKSPNPIPEKLETGKAGMGKMLSLQDKLKQQRAQMQKSEDKDHTKNAGSVDVSEIKDELKSAESDGRGRVVKDEGFVQVEAVGKNGEEQRSALLEINREKSLEHFSREDQKKEYRGASQGGQDKISFAIKTDDGRTVELNLQQIRSMEKFMEEDVRNKAEATKEKKAA